MKRCCPGASVLVLARVCTHRRGVMVGARANAVHTAHAALDWRRASTSSLRARCALGLASPRLARRLKCVAAEKFKPVSVGLGGRQSCWP